MGTGKGEKEREQKEKERLVSAVQTSAPKWAQKQLPESESDTSVGLNTGIGHHGKHGRHETHGLESLAQVTSNRLPACLVAEKTPLPIEKTDQGNNN